MSVLFLSFLFSCAGPKTEPSKPMLDIHEVQPNKLTHLTRQNLEHLVKVYDLAPLIFTRRIEIQSGVIPHSHPVLTLNTRFAQDPQRLLAVFLHQQFHWWTEQNPTSIKQAKMELKKIFPEPPIKERGNRVVVDLHLIIGFLEVKALTYYLGEAESKKVIQKMIAEDKMDPWIYHQVYQRYVDFQRIIRDYQLEPRLLQDQKPTKKP